MEGLIAAGPGRHARPLRRRQRRRRQRHDHATSRCATAARSSRSNNELNGLSLGGIGRDTDIHHVEIMNNVDDGIEIWGGTVNLKYFNIWNIGDDSFDVDQGWRGKAQFGLIVQGYSVTGRPRRQRRARASATTASRPTAPRTPTSSRSRPRRSTTSPSSASRSARTAATTRTAWRDNARVQYRNCIFMDLGERARVASTTSTATAAPATASTARSRGPTTWTTAYNAVLDASTPRRTRPAFYQAQTSGKLAEITDSVFFSNTQRHGLHRGDSATAASSRPATTTCRRRALSPITAITRGLGLHDPDDLDAAACTRPRSASGERRAHERRRGAERRLLHAGALPRRASLRPCPRGSTGWTAS